MSFTLKNRVALVTGSSRGLGRGIAMTLGKAGATVALNYARNPDFAAKTLAKFQESGGRGAMFQADVSDESEVARLVREVESKLGPIDIVVVNATPDQPQLPIEEYTWKHYQAMIDFFIKSPYLLTRTCLPHMKSQRWGRIINIGSEVFQRSLGNFSAYVSAKGGQIGFTRSMASELAPFGITVNIVSPGWIPTERHENDPQEQKDGYRALIPANRWGTPDDVGAAVLYLASEEASFITGQTICVNGGMTPW